MRRTADSRRQLRDIQLDWPAIKPDFEKVIRLFMPGYSLRRVSASPLR